MHKYAEALAGLDFSSRRRAAVAQLMLDSINAMVEDHRVLDLLPV